MGMSGEGGEPKTAKPRVRPSGSWNVCESWGCLWDGEVIFVEFDDKI